VIESAAALAHDLLRDAPQLQILATSREPLRAQGEHVHRLSGLALPAVSAGLTAASAQAFPAIELFVERAAAASGTFALGDREAPLVADICRRLDGIPLAIELAAARVDSLGVQGLALHLHDPLQLIAGARRAAPARHQTMRASLDWGYALLAAPERAVLRRLAIFPGGFTLDAASALAATSEIPPAEVVEHVASLVAKSLLAADLGGIAPSYRLLATTRAYALEKLSESGEIEQVGHRHAASLRSCGHRPFGDRTRPARGRSRRSPEQGCSRLAVRAVTGSRSSDEGAEARLIDTIS
jgi:predicted ATPase